MPNFTKIAIRNAFLKLLSEKPLNKISVRDIVEECGINRNSFYYHFQDVPTLLEEIVMDEADKLITDYTPSDPVEKCFTEAMNFADEHRNTILHVYRCIDRELLESHLWTVCQRIVEAYTNKRSEGKTVSDEDRALLNKLLKCQLFGLVIDWANDGMQHISEERIRRFCDMLSGFTDNCLS